MRDCGLLQGITEVNDSLSSITERLQGITAINDRLRSVTIIVVNSLSMFMNGQDVSIIICNNMWIISFQEYGILSSVYLLWWDDFNNLAFVNIHIYSSTSWNSKSYLNICKMFLIIALVYDSTCWFVLTLIDLPCYWTTFTWKLAAGMHLEI